MDDVVKLVNLPWATLVTLASGYAAYYIANVGVRDHHKPIDVAFSTLVFGFFSAFAYAVCRRRYGADLLAASVFAFGAALVIGASWSLFGRATFERLLRRSQVSLSDDLPSAWMALFRAKTYATQLSVKLKDGSWVKCEDLNAFTECPNGPCVLGAKGDVLMYVTHIKSPSDEDFEPCTGLIDKEWGDEVTYIPADQIMMIDFRRRKK
ncbi:hypothetical protein MTX26_27745 [Bradyrhizobium sp. ISRA443]|uniref:hypothetical protein n=1 Tax=unclassified Bradyrhizobium TaxID=2631580 RepID=UPI00247A68D4|nr:MULTISPECIES: hypothetical protein [unclassified Bradyrhizobium]WGR93509.1 hypothetical protein MTX20_02600 [Bradyrhizobium sp. ISRA435]WGR98059.1 hypothetical protein MTX23_27735 [Bradyrhizobium sp. ISRA436]WGS04948.1 hypothetical protein MTX18_27740 [Bradyrhizobium sp. ISRA437]WGS11832.1 hypothetical protein MTX26_27745 [Bradyrhizobium sp. ISRA443]